MKRIILVLILVIIIVNIVSLKTGDESSYIKKIQQSYTATIIYNEETTKVCTKVCTKKVTGININTTNYNKGYIVFCYTGSYIENMFISITYNRFNCNMYRVDNIYNKSIFNLAYGNGTYIIEVFQFENNIKYILAIKNITVDDIDEFTPFLISTYSVKYNDDMKVIKDAKKITKDLSNNFDKVRKIYDFVLDNITYEQDENEYYGQWSYFTDIDKIYTLKKGICTDYATMFTAICRSQSIPCKVITGYNSLKDVYHTWVEVYVEGENIRHINGNAIRPNKWSKIDLVYDDFATKENSGIVLKEVYEVTNVD